MKKWSVKKTDILCRTKRDYISYWLKAQLEISLFQLGEFLSYFFVRMDQAFSSAGAYDY